MTTYQVPISASSSQLEFVTNARSFEDPFTGTIQTAARTGNRWLITLTFNNVQGTRRRIMQSFIMKLRGQENRFFTRDFGYVGAFGTPTGTPLVDGASQTGNSLVTDGWTASTAIFEEGDEFQVGNFLKMITADVSSNGSGQATLTFEPQLHTSPANDDPIDISEPTGQFIMIGNRSGWSDQLGGFSNFVVVGIEDVLA